MKYQLEFKNKIFEKSERLVNVVDVFQIPFEREPQDLGQLPVVHLHSHIFIFFIFWYYNKFGFKKLF